MKSPKAKKYSNKIKILTQIFYNWYRIQTPELQKTQLKSNFKKALKILLIKYLIRNKFVNKNTKTS